ncbi:MAG: hypothetical protein V4719_14780 [Planctomycetota bacterium]
MDQISRRGFTQQALGSLLTFTLLDTLLQRDAFADSVKPLTVKWLADVNQLGNDLKDEKLKQLEWQKKVKELFSQVDLPDLLQLVDFEKLTQNVTPPEQGAQSLSFKFQQIDGVPTQLVFGKQIFALRQGCSVVPHGHNNMATAFLVLKGEFQGRHYDRLEDLPQHMIIRPTIDEKFGPGGCSTVSDLKDNVHWFQALSAPAYIFNIHVNNINPQATESTGRVYLDPHGEKLSDGRIKARLIGYDESKKRYG